MGVAVAWHAKSERLAVAFSEAECEVQTAAVGGVHASRVGFHGLCIGVAVQFDAVAVKCCDSELKIDDAIYGEFLTDIYDVVVFLLADVEAVVDMRRFVNADADMQLKMSGSHGEGKKEKGYTNRCIPYGMKKC